MRDVDALPLSERWELGQLSDFAIDGDDIEFLQAIIVDACNELKISPDHQGFVTRVVDLRSKVTHARKSFKILEWNSRDPLTVGILASIHEDCG
ncbi:hypothetical protein [Rhizobium laguerreae]|uniref:hypothetical protein n=1 Tax=Rhizobium laguerreae TaxID=1076926 RepID=UPI001C8FB231|nr:hypothetical protein [Rhizobium laguerreae]MBY3168175.1 hypothetical protein [Rhizobium laguerreae]